MILLGATLTARVAPAQCSLMAYRECTRRCNLLAVAVLLLAARAVPALDVATARLVDLTHPFDDTTIYWPTARRFHLDPVAHGMTPGGWWYAANDFCAAEHGGTHLDAPIHFAEGGWTADDIPLDRLRGPAAVVDVRARAAADRDLLVGVAHLEADEAAHGRIPEGAIVLVRTGWERYWPDAERYLGTAARGDVEHLHFPGLSEEAARWLLTERMVRGVGIDTASIDRGQSKDFRAHRALGAANGLIFENLANLEALPARGAAFLGLPMKIRGGSGGPLRAIALLP
jgi:kynurenine formamidase